MVKNGKFTWPVRVVLLVVAALTLFGPKTITSIRNRINSQINLVYTRQMSEWANGNLPQKADLVEKIDWADENSSNVILLIKSDLTMDQIKDFYENAKNSPARRGYDIDITVNGSDKDLQFEQQMAEYLATAYHGSIQKFDTNSPYQSFFIVKLEESKHSSDGLIQHLDY